MADCRSRSLLLLIALRSKVNEQRKANKNPFGRHYKNSPVRPVRRMPATCGLQAIGIAMKNLSRSSTIHNIGYMMARMCLSLHGARNTCFQLSRSICESGQFNSELYRFLSCHGKVAYILWGPNFNNSVQVPADSGRMHGIACPRVQMACRAFRYYFMMDAVSPMICVGG